MTSTTIDDVEAVLHGGESSDAPEEVDYWEGGRRRPATATDQDEDETEGGHYMSVHEEDFDGDDLDMFQSVRENNNGDNPPPLRRSNCTSGVDDEYRDKLNDMFGGKGSRNSRLSKGTDSMHTTSTRSLVAKPIKRLESMFTRLENKAHEKIFQGQYTKRECTYVLGAGVFGCFNYGASIQTELLKELLLLRKVVATGTS